MREKVRLTVRLPSGNEHWYADVPEVGALLSHFGSEYVVVSVEERDDGSFVVTVAEPPDVEAAMKSSP